MPKAVNFPSLAGIQDNQTRQALAAIIQHLRERSGEAGDNESQYATRIEFDQLAVRVTDLEQTQ